MTHSEFKKFIDKFNKRIKRVEKAFKFDKETTKMWRDQIKPLVGNTDMLTKSGLLSSSKKSMDLMMKDDTMEVLSNFMPQTVTELKESAEEALEDYMEADEEIAKNKEVYIRNEIVSKIKVLSILDEADNTSYISDTIKEWRETVKSAVRNTELISENPMLYTRLKELDKEITDVTKLTYTDMYTILTDAQKAIEDYSTFKKGK